MKKLIVTLIITVSSLVAAAQHDTLPYYVGVPQFYMDHQLYDALHVTTHNGATCTPINTRIVWTESNREHIYETGYGGYTDDVAVGFHSNSTLHVIGIAMPAWDFNTINGYIRELYAVCCNDSNRNHFNYDSILFRLYVPKSDSTMMLVKAVTMDSTFDTTNCRLFRNFQGLDFPDYAHLVEVMTYPVMEVYFDNEIDIRDSFYISCSYVQGTSYRSLLYGWSEDHNPDVDTFVYPVYSFRFRRDATSSSDPWQYAEAHGYPLVWPIIRRDCDTCPTPQGIQHFQAGGNQAFFRWQRTDPQRSWQLSYGPAGTAPEDGTIVDCSNPVSGSFQFEPGVEYVAYVRGRCRFARFEYGPWSAPYTFTLGDAGIEAALPDSAVDLTPNPASGEVTVRCSERMTLLELFNAAGDKVHSQQLSTTNYKLSTTNFPTGTYLVRITTEQGVATRKLVIR